jgi:hypothetical protein
LVGGRQVMVNRFFTWNIRPGPDAIWPVLNSVSDPSIGLVETFCV